MNNALQRIHFNDSFHQTTFHHDEKVVDDRGNLHEIQDIHYDALLIQPQTASSASAKHHAKSLAINGHEAQQLQGRMSFEYSALRDVLKNSRFSTCTDVQTLDSTPSLITDENGLASNGFIHSILTRRLGLIVGCCLGIIVFIVMISILSYVKLKKQRIENAKRRAALPPDYMSYRHFSIPNDDSFRGGSSGGGGGGGGTIISSVPSGISAHISGTSLSISGNNTVTATTAASTPLGILKVTADAPHPDRRVNVEGNFEGCLVPDLTATTSIGVVSDVAVNLATAPTPASVANNQNHQLALRNQQQQQQQQQAYQHTHHLEQHHQGNGNIGGHLQATPLNLVSGGLGQHLAVANLASNQHFSSHPDAC